MCLYGHHQKARNAVLKQLNDVDTKSKLAACTSRKPEECEVYIVEGDSALGACKLGRDAEFQAIIPIRGKILNCLKADYNKIFNNSAVSRLLLLANICAVILSASNLFSIK